jgi:hypothetical protein
MTREQENERFWMQQQLGGTRLWKKQGIGPKKKSVPITTEEALRIYNATDKQKLEKKLRTDEMFKAALNKPRDNAELEAIWKKKRAIESRIAQMKTRIPRR